MVNLKAKTFREVGMAAIDISALQHPGQGSTGGEELMSTTKKSSNNNSNNSNNSEGDESDSSNKQKPSQSKSPSSGKLSHLSPSNSSTTLSTETDASDDDEDYHDELKELSPAMKAVLTKNQMRRMSRIEAIKRASNSAIGSGPATLKKPKAVITGRMSMFNGTGLSKLLIDDLDTVHHEDFDAGVHAMALLCALLLSVPYSVVERIDFLHLAWLQTSIDKCDAESNSFEYNHIYALYRGSFLATVYMSIGGMILATFYFLFKRTDEADYKVWRRKARLLVTTLFFFTAFAICALILMTNMYFNYYLLSDLDDICNNKAQQFMIPGLALAAISFTWSFYLIL